MSLEQQNKNKDEKVLLLVTILGSIFLGFLLPLIIWLVQKDTFSAYANDIVKGTLNFQLTILIASLICSLLSFVGIGCILVPIVYVVNIVILVLASVAVSSGSEYKYPLTIHFVK